MKKMKIAIIGGGVSGLSLAYSLESKGIDFMLFEKEKSLGGNACTRQTEHNGRQKHVDMAVNDFNPDTYHRLTELLDKTGSPTGRVNVNTTFFSSDHFLFRESDLTGTGLAG
ncbi:MAG: FAD-dependent oxidoreductase, partial [Bacteroidetes bacterium]